MRSALLLLMTCLAASAQGPGRAAAMEGVIVNALTNAPMPGVHLKVFSISVGATNATANEAYGAITGADGHFSIRQMKPATYIVNPEYPGYVQAPVPAEEAWNTLSLALTPGQTLTLKMKMTPKAVLAGRVTDENGDPVPGAEVTAVPVKSGPATGMAAAPKGKTDERGMFRIRGVPGRYYVSAAIVRVPGSQFDGIETRSDGSQAAAYGVTWFPGVTDKAAASAIDAQPGKELSAIDIRLVPRRSVSIRGTVRGISFGNGAYAYVQLWPGETIQQQYAGMKGVSAAPDGSFAFAGLTPGSYTISAMGQTGSATKLRSSFQTLKLDASDLTVDLQLTAGETLAGSLEIAGGGQHSVTLEPLSPLQKNSGLGLAAQSGRDGGLQFNGVMPAQYRVKVAPLPEDDYIQSVQIDSAEAPDGVVDFSGGIGGRRLKVRVANHAAAVEGMVLDKEGKPSQSPLAYVVLATNIEDALLADGLDTAKPVERGKKFSFRNLRPGKYHFFAVDPLQVATVDSLKESFLNSEVITIKEGEHLTRDLRLNQSVK